MATVTSNTIIEPVAAAPVPTISMSLTGTPNPLPYTGGGVSLTGTSTGIPSGTELVLSINGVAYPNDTLLVGSSGGFNSTAFNINLAANTSTTVETTYSFTVAYGGVTCAPVVVSVGVAPVASISIAFTGTPTTIPYGGGGVTVTGTSTGIPAGASITLWVVPPGGSATALGEMTVGSGGGFNSTTFSINLAANTTQSIEQYQFYATYP